MNFELRELKATDLFGMVKILNGIGLSEIKEAININEIKNARKNVTDDNQTDIWSEIGVNVVMSVLGVVLNNIPRVEKELYSFIGGVANLKPTQVANLGIVDFTDLLIAIFKKEEFKDFFNRASKLIQ